MIQAEIVADSINDTKHRITSFLLTYPRFIHSELMTHRAFSRNAASSRAIPIEKMIKRIQDEPAMPVVWGKNQKGMQAASELSTEESHIAKDIWRRSSLSQIEYVRELSSIGVHKQIANRLLEPFAHMQTLVTATEYGNFFNLRAHKDAQPEFQELAFQMLELYANNKPQYKKHGEWHLPFADRFLEEGLSVSHLLKISTARAARTSYMNFKGAYEHEEDYLLHDRLSESGHWSPFEHPACSMSRISMLIDNMRGKRKQGNFNGYMPYRKTFPTENKAQFNAEQLLKNRRGKS
jgi:thymidylate synthase ThyX